MKSGSASILIVDDDAGVRVPACAWLHAAGLTAHGVATVGAALEFLEGFVPDVVVLDLELPDRPGLELLQLLSLRHPQLPVLVLTAHRDAEVAVACMKAGAFDYLVKPVDEPRLVTTAANALRHAQVARAMAGLERALAESGRDPRTARWRAVERVASRDLGVLLVGGDAGGREACARAIHGASPRAAGAFQAVDCGAGPRGRALGGPERWGGLARGTLFLDRLERLAPEEQDVLAERLGGAARARGGAPDGVDVRVLAGTGGELEAEVRGGRFRADLLMRIAVDRIELEGVAPADAVGGSQDAISLADRERAAILEALARSRGNRADASRQLGISRATFYRKLKQYGIE